MGPWYSYEDGTDIQNHQPPMDSSWYRRKLNSLKETMTQWYINGIYKLTESGEYSVSKCYNTVLARQVRLLVIDLVWTSIMMPRKRFIVWLANKERLLTNERLQRMNIATDDVKCGLCVSDKLETQKHLFVDCEWTKPIQQELHRWSGIPYELTSQKTLIWFKRRNWKQFHKELVTATWGALIYHIWKARNWKQFNNAMVPADMVITRIKEEVQEREDYQKCTKRAYSRRQLIQELGC